MTRHGMRDTPTYSSWRAMVRRCTDPKFDSYLQYGGRGILVCERWLNSFVAFLADMGERPSGTSIDRIEGKGHYEPRNCRWATRHEQSSNRALARGELDGNAKLSDLQVRVIRKFRSELGWTLNDIAEIFNCSLAQVHNVCSGKSRLVVSFAAGQASAVEGVLA